MSHRSDPKAGLTSYEVRQIAERAGVTVPAIYARIRVGDTGARLWRRGGGQGRSVGHQAMTPRALQRDVDWDLIRRRADAKGIPRATLLARVEAGWPVDRLLDDVKRWRRLRRH